MGIGRHFFEGFSKLLKAISMPERLLKSVESLLSGRFARTFRLAVANAKSLEKLRKKNDKVKYQ